MFDSINTVLILAPHPDDAEFGLGGTITKLIEDKKTIYIALFSTCEISTPEGFEKGVIMEEFFQSCNFLGIPKENILCYNFEVRHFPKFRQEILEELVLLKKSIAPDLIFIPSSSDMHQDHSTIYMEAQRCFKHSNLLGYEMPWNNFEFKSLMYVVLQKSHLEKKIEALRIYKSQAHRPYNEEDFVLSLSKIRGIQVNAENAESFEIIRYIQK
jgi:LmbE family N-acetylglucosaminyl deacetylase